VQSCPQKYRCDHWYPLANREVVVPWNERKNGYTRDECVSFSSLTGYLVSTETTEEYSKDA
jgi:hypothetical protein